MKIATILPYKENYSTDGAGAVALWVKDFMQHSKYKKKNTVYGSTINNNYLSQNYHNIEINSLKSKFYSTTKEYSQKLIKEIIKKDFDVIEIHNRPIMVKEFIKSVKSKIILYFHNDPTSMKGAKTSSERKELLNNVDKIIFISNWVKEKFFENISFNTSNKTEIIYHSIKKKTKFISKRKKQIIFVGKLNESKGYDLFCKALKNVLSIHKNWRAFSIGEEKRFQPYDTHKNHLNLGQIPHKKVLKIFEKSEIAIIPSRWEEPFGRTSLEASSRGCATIISKKGGLTETTDHAVILKELNSKNLEKEILNLIKNTKLRNKLQKEGFKNVKHVISDNAIKIDNMRAALFPFSYFNPNNGKLRILNIYNLGQKLNHRIYNLSLGKKFTNGFVRSGHDVIEISDRDYVKQNKSISFFNIKNKFQNYLLETFKNYNPNLVIFGHSDNINLEILDKFKSINKNLIISQWNEDPFVSNFNDSKINLNKLNKFLPLVDHTFLTTDPNSIIGLKNRIKNNIHFFMTPVDKNIECFDVFNLKPQNDLFYAMSHGVNRATLKDGKIDNRVNFLNKLVNQIKGIKHDFYGFNKQEPIWGNDFYRALINSKMALNLSRGVPTKYYSSNRIASLIGNGLLVFVDKKVKLNDFFTDKEMIFYNSINDLADKIKFYSKNDKSRILISKNGKNKYFKLFNETKISKYIVDKSIGKNTSLI